MRTITVLTLVGTVVGILWWHTTTGVPVCAKPGYNKNGPCLPYAAEEGWYSYCYIHNGRWIVYPYRCGYIDPANVTAGFKEFDEKTCVEPDMPSECPVASSSAGYYADDVE